MNKKITSLMMLSLCSLGLIGCSSQQDNIQTESNTSSIVTQKPSTNVTSDIVSNEDIPTTNINSNISPSIATQKPSFNSNSNIDKNTSDSTVSANSDKTSFNILGNEILLDIDDSWTEISMSGAEFAYIIDYEYATNVNLLTEYMQGYSFDKYLELSYDYLEKTANIKNMSTHKMTVAGMNAGVVQYTVNQGDVNVYIYQVCFEKDGYAYIFSFGTKNPNYDTSVFDDFVKSIEFK